ncbi:hypothetical protein I6N96_04705 [Enterococcus sp. BWM-S5]|uniref:Uncharacterized protein n=1 Tax=Enterococcus larvae TaxID=2794352 RepID=A0ABS4CH20_9ENTE|nr:hypothetical protein [Enterococcus larvae]MBP1045567.1 hypothetical protein [Enterococcus larvae]
MRKIIFGVVLFIVAYISYTVDPNLFAIFKDVKSLVRLTFVLAIILIAFRKKMNPDESE